MVIDPGDATPTGNQERAANVMFASLCGADLKTARRPNLV
jgi:hypothetical protein